MRVVALVESEDHVCCRYRMAAFRELFASVGHDLELVQLPTTTFGRMGLGRSLSQADVVIVQRKLLPRWTINLLRHRVRRLVFDFDDAVWLRDSYSLKGFDDSKRLNRFRAMLAACDLVVSGNSFLAAEAAKYVAPNRVVVIPTCVEPAKYASHTSSSREGLQLVWIGSQSTLRGLEQFTTALSAIGQQVPGTRLKLICDKFITIPGLTTTQCVWREATEATEIASADVGISWVPDDPWSRGKCGLKILQYQAAGLPVVANPVGVQQEMVRYNETGYAATTTEEWVRAIMKLSADASLRERLGRAGRRQVLENYSVANGARLWRSALESIAKPMRKSG